MRATSRAVIATGIVFLSLSGTAKSQLPPEDKTRAEFSRFFELNAGPAVLPKVMIGERRLTARAEVAKSPKSADQRNRLMKYQEQRMPQPDVKRFIANNPVLEEVSAGEDRDFAQVIFWNEVALRMTANDHTPPPPGSGVETHPFEQVGPARTSRAMAITHIAMFEAVNAVYRNYNSYKGIQKRIFDDTSLPPDTKPVDVSVRHAVAIAAHNTLLKLYPNKAADLALTLAANLTQIQESPNRATAGIAIGEAAATAILDLRKADRSDMPEPDAASFATSDPFTWKKDPLTPDLNTALGGNWRFVTPFVIERADVYRPPVPPLPGSADYMRPFKDVFDKGGDPDGGKIDPPGNALRRPTPSNRVVDPAFPKPGENTDCKPIVTSDETFIGKFWAYDGTALLCAPPRLYNMIATSLALNERRASIPDALELARLLALVNVAMADAGIAAWEAKYYYLYPRPVTAIRATPGVGNAFWTPLGAPVSNAKAGRLNFSPPFPAYPSGHAVFGGALFEVLRGYWPDKAMQGFTFVSDEYNGRNSDPGAPAPRPCVPRKFADFDAPEKENAQSRIYLGIHWQFDADEGIKQGNKVGKFVFGNAFTPAKK
ncbi:MAG: vanadium-dependent haloperoxidase [Gemmataceae bacterium]